MLGWREPQGGDPGENRGTCRTGTRGEPLPGGYDELEQSLPAPHLNSPSTENSAQVDETNTLLGLSSPS
jgi:hypothetical protein